MKTKRILSILIVLAFLSCKKNEAESKPEKINQTEKPAVQADSTGDEKSADEAVINDEGQKLLLDFYKKNEQKPQRFLIGNNNDTVINCIQKTKIHIKANSFVTETGKAVSGKIQFSVTEYYKISDMLLAKLSTTTNGNLLETGGMLNITATSNGGKCILKKGKTIQIEFPRKEEKPGMQLYTGSWSNNMVNWQLIKNTEDLNQTFTDVDIRPDFPGGIQKFYDYIARNINYLDGKSQKIFAGFTIDKEGKVINPKIIRGGSKGYNVQIIRLLRNSPKFIPGMKNGIPVNVYYTLPIKIEASEIDYFEGNEEDVQKNFEKNYDDKNLANAGVQTINSYLFSTSYLGYINCDRLWKNTMAPTIDYALRFENDSETSVNVIFHRVTSVMSNFTSGDKVYFKNIPLGEKVTIFVVKYFDGKPFLAVKESMTSSKAETGFSFKPVTMETLKKEMKKLDEL